MKDGKYEVILQPKGLTAANIEIYEKVCRYLLQRCCEEYEEHEGSDIFEGVDGGTG